ncbi:uncharacterized protein Jasper isoform X1 [Tribolium castaneum]|uniref:uncharacterized protein Jasper isoform X1 n=1 Tax=Tribolium castaneum TaxID=7070 RepID=UPI00046BF489|nr:PREDICTED: uncharacterized protein LOC654941 isoform X1 [Tribolium castaneum]|eukprot:XP_008195560.1 PREDICTED: uncharacterized protein LOC654941 isoform X1 [Tribolium castaneum]
MKRTRSFKEGDKVFAKIKGYPAWPAVILAKSGKKFNVQFYGTGETGFIKPEDIFYYLKNKEQMVKGSKKKEFKDAVEQIEKAIAEDGTDGDESGVDAGAPAPKRKRSNSEKSSDSVPSKVSSNARNSESEGESNMSESAVDGPNESRIESENKTFGSADENNAVDEDLPFLPNIKVVSELNLKNWIIYADAVKEKPELYKSRPVDQRHYFENQVFPVLLPSGKYAGLKLHKKWPLHFENEYECAIYDSDTASRVLLLKDAVTSGEITPESNPESFLDDFDLTETEIKRDAEMKLINSKYKRVERLRAESSLVELDAKIKNCLGLNKAEPKKALEFLDSLLEINMDEIMLKKHSHVVEMIRRLRKYVGNLEEWNLPPEELETFNNDAQKVRTKADEIYKKFKSVCKLPAGSVNFWDGFNDIVRKFREDCIHLNNREVFVLCAEPYSRQAIIDRLEQEEELQEADIHRPVDSEIEKVADVQ